ncbi:DUF4160 domain-containing protein [Acidaminococcus fermentans]|uniref:DUF4160 domain-containing protein n=1 Tax=Acidaminococcus fermentans (strain ATCC 25085 / DSM 20731 / CCUG 9996 / CIP 106432 / VR4) TaxID=591001 RepID=D2RJ14_ACIFV|nr:hypothetical protein Acfer_0672 [Acidaminococcus fermentans DSM 20731]UEA72333.1 DUF4160 domain-containing protein [Acidaminococcus fermentans DSM 20731]
MPQLFRIGPYLIYFWSNENNPVEPVHVHIAEGKPSPNATKVWITESGGSSQQQPIPRFHNGRWSCF